MGAKKTKKAVISTIKPSSNVTKFDNASEAESSIIQSVFYASPYASLPPGVGTAGVTVQVNTDQIPPSLTNPILVIRLRLTTTPTTVGISKTSGTGTSKSSAIFQPAFPLSTSEPYMVDLIWVESGTPQQNINWADAVTSAPVTASNLEIVNASFDGNYLTAAVSYAISSCGVGAQVNLFSLSAGVYVYVGKAQTQGNSVIVPMKTTGYPAVYFISIQSAIPTTNGGGTGGYAAPFSLGPQSKLLGIPQAANTISSAVYDGETLTLNWDLKTIEGCVNPDSSVVEVLENGNIIATYIGGATSANFQIGILEQDAITVNIATVAQKISSQAISSEIITGMPTVTNVITNTDGTTVTADVATVTSGPAIQAYLMDGDIQVAGPSPLNNGKVSFQYNAKGRVGLSVIAKATSTDGKLVGPISSQVPLLATAPTLKNATVVTDPSDQTKWKIDCEWFSLLDAPKDISSYTISIQEDATEVSTITLSGTSATFSIDKTAIDVTKPHTINIHAMGISGGFSPSNSWAILFVAPELASIVTNTSQIEATWNVPTGIPADNTLPVEYQIMVTKADGSVIYEATPTKATQGAISLSEISLTADTTVVILVNVSLGPVLLISNASMATKCSATPILNAPTLNSTTVYPINNKATLHWETDPAATSYTLNFSDGTSQTGITTNSYALTQALTIDSRLSFTIEIVGVSNTVSVTGPPTKLTTIPVSTANMISVRYDGTNAEAIWETVTNAQSYKVYVYDNSETPAQTYLGTTTETSLTFPLTTETSKEYTVYVQAILENGAGLSGTSLNLFTTGIFISKQLVTSAYPYLYISESMANLGTSSAAPSVQTTVLYLPELGIASGALGTVPITQDPFTIEPSGNTSLPYKLTIGTAAWSFDTTDIRTTLVTAYTNFLKDLETPPTQGEGITGATPYGISLVQAAIASYMPQTFAEILFYNFGLSTMSTVGSGYVDLQSGMVLRATISDYINIPEYNVPTWVNGYAGATTLDFNIGSYNTLGNDWRVGFDGFLNVLSKNGALSVNVPASSSNSSQAGIAGGVDLYYPQFLQPFYRIYFPDQIQNPSVTGTNTTTTNFTIVAADSYTNLLTTDVNPANTSTAYFRGRTTLEVLIKIIVNGTEQLVPIGTSIGNVLEQLGMRPATTNGVFKTLRIYRSIQAALNNLDANKAIEPTLEIRFDWDGLAVYSDGNGLNAMNMPVVAGDQIFTNKA